jgi:hypothetical protein
MSLLLAQSGKMRLIELHSFLRTPSRDKTQQNSAANAAVGQQRTKSSAPVRLAPERGLQSRSIFLAKSGGVTIFRREDR